MDFTKLKEFMEHLTDWRIPGNSIVVYHKGSEVFRHSSGFSDIENKIKMTGDELINIYSCSKVATVVAALQLYLSFHSEAATSSEIMNSLSLPY